VNECYGLLKDKNKYENNQHENNGIRGYYQFDSIYPAAQI
jgi:hypothetical protein